MKNILILFALFTLPLLVQAQSTVSVCSGQNVTLAVADGILGSGASWRWYTNAACTGTSVHTGDTYALTNVTANATYYVRAEGDCDTSAAVSIAVTVNALPTAGTLNSADICYGESATLTATGVAGSGTIAQYSYDNGVTWSASNTYSTGGLVADRTYTLRVKNSNSCISPAAPAVTGAVAVCPYTAGDRVAGSCSRVSGAWVAQMRDARDNKVYNIKRNVTTGAWYFTRFLNWTDGSATNHQCNPSFVAYEERNNPEQMCPAGWAIPTTTQLQQNVSDFVVASTYDFVGWWTTGGACTYNVNNWQLVMMTLDNGQLRCRTRVSPSVGNCGHTPNNPGAIRCFKI